MIVEARTEVKILVTAQPGEIVLRKPPSEFGWSVARMLVTVYEDLITDEVFTHLDTVTTRLYRERDVGGWSANSSTRRPTFSIRVEMLPQHIIRLIEDAYATRRPFGVLLPTWDVQNGKAVPVR